jgi:hypothetical protein
MVELRRVSGHEGLNLAHQCPIADFKNIVVPRTRDKKTTTDSPHPTRS